MPIHLVVFVHIQNMMTFLVLMLLCLLFCFDSYPFEPHHLTLRLCFGRNLDVGRHDSRDIQVQLQ